MKPPDKKDYDDCDFSKEKNEEDYQKALQCYEEYMGCAEQNQQQMFSFVAAMSSSAPTDLYGQLYKVGDRILKQDHRREDRAVVGVVTKVTEDEVFVDGNLLNYYNRLCILPAGLTLSP